jgi:hypothetical protein
MIKNTPVLITGCQRSGTTLLYLILDSHPQIRGMDEWEFEETLLDKYLIHPEYHPCVAFKLPKVSHLVPALLGIPGIKVLWCLRDPRDVVTSMLRLQRDLKTGKREKLLWSLRNPQKAFKSLITFKPLPLKSSWAGYSLGAREEIARCATTLKHHGLVTEELNLYLRRYKNLRRKYAFQLAHKEEVLLGALCWRVKQEVLNICSQNNSLHIVQYETLIQNPEKEVQAILQFLNVPWHENVLKHHTLHAGVSVGQTDNTRPIDAQNLEKWKAFLSEDDVGTIAQICAGAAKGFYHL